MLDIPCILRYVAAMQKRLVNDAYNTPLAVANACVRAVDWMLGREAAVHEPHVGGGSFLQALRTARPDLVLSASDLDRDVEGFAYALAHDIPAVDIDFLDTAPEGVDWFIGNPPYNAAQAHVEHALQHANKGVAFLLRLAFLESNTRRELFKRGDLFEIIVLSRRPSFTQGRTDSAAYALFVWRKGFYGYPTLRWMDWK
jgi:hypothetical protein